MNFVRIEEQRGVQIGAGAPGAHQVRDPPGHHQEQGERTLDAKARQHLEDLGYLEPRGNRATAPPDKPGDAKHHDISGAQGGGTQVGEGGTTDTFTVVLTAQPASNVALAITSGDIGEATVNPTMLTFTPANWNLPQTVTVTGVDDLLADGRQTTTITVSVDDAASDDAFDGVADQTVSAITLDDEPVVVDTEDAVGVTIVGSWPVSTSSSGAK